MEVISLFVGLFLLGLILAIRRVLDKGSLFGSIGLHGGLIGLWFLVDSGLINILDNKHSWLIVSGNTARNPIGGLIAIFTLLIIIFYHRTAFAIALEPLNGACNASSNGATP